MRIARILFVAVFAISACLPIRVCSATSPVEIGVLTPFYRHTQLQGHLIGLGLMEIPEYVEAPDIDFRYQKKPGMTREVPFVDSFTINRFLGGYPEEWLRKFKLWDDQLGPRSLDYVIRKSDGSLQYRPELIQRRLAPYIEAGYAPAKITIALENVPWDLAASPQAGEWGQHQPPANLQEWRQVISHFAGDLKAYLGDAASSIFFKTGVEFDQKESFNGTPDEFYAYYSATSEGLHSVLPTVSLTPGEFTRGGACPPRLATCVYDTNDFLRFARTHHLEIGDVPRSLNSFMNHGDPMPSTAVTRAVESYSRLPSGTIPEIHQFGLMFEPFGKQDGSDPAILRANFEFQSLMGLWEKLRPRQVFHWGGFVEVGDLKFLNGSGFLRLILDHYLGYHAYRLFPEELDKSGASAPAELMAINFRNATTSAIVISSFSPATGFAKRRIKVEFPGISHGRSMKTIRYRASDNVFLMIRKDLDKANNLKREFVDCSSCLGPPISMAADANSGRVMLRNNWPQYEAIMKRDLKWNTHDDNVAMSGSELFATLEYNELMVVEPQ
jgi:hypothetical protein